MFKLRRFYLDNIGSGELDFENMTLDFVDEHTGKVASDCIVNGENGGGKTTILSMFFTLLRPHKEQFIQRLQKKNHHFDEYIKSTPGLILAELVHHREDGVETYILGQYMMMKSDGESYREFFYLPGSIDGNAFDRVPSIGRGTLDRKEDIRAFISGHGSVFSTQDQSDWEAKLEGLGFDYKQIAAQIQFCRSEGGIDAFADFKSERQFLEVLFDLTMQSDDVDQVGRQLNKVIEQHQELPKFEKQVLQLNEITGLIQGFIGEAKTAAFQKNELESLTKSARGHWRYAREALDQLLADTKLAGETITEQKKALSELKKAIKTGRKRLSMMRLREVRIDAGRLSDERNKQEQAREESKQRESLLDLARHYLDYQEAQRAYLQKAELMADLTRGLDKVRASITNLKIHRSKVNEEKWQQALLKINELKAEQEVIKERGIQRKQSLLARKAEESAYQKSIMELKFFIEQHEKEEARLTEKGWLDAHMDLNTQVSKMAMAVSDLETKVAHDDERLKRERDGYRVQQDEYGKSLARHNELKADLSASKGLQESYSRQAYALRVSLSSFLQEPKEEVNVYGNYVESHLEPMIIARQISVHELDKQKYQLMSEYQAIESGDGLMVDPEAMALKEQMEAVGIQSKFALDYLIEIESQDVEAVAGIVASDPARYLGLMVNSEKDLELVSSKAGQWKIKKPVMVSLTNNAEGALSEEEVVVAPLSNVLYSRDETTQYLAQLNKDIAALNEQSKEKQALIEQAQRLKTRLEDFHLQYPEAETQRRQEGIALLEKSIANGQSALEELNGKVQAVASGITALEEGLNADRLVLAEQNKRHDALREFRDEHARPLPDRRQGMKAAKEGLSLILEVIKQEELSLEETREALVSQQHAVHQQAHLAKEWEKEMSRHGVTIEQRQHHTYDQALLLQSVEQLDVDIETAERELSRKEQDAGYSIKQKEIDQLKGQSDRLRVLFIEQKNSIPEEQVVAIANGRSLNDLATEKGCERERYSQISKVLAELEVKQGELNREEGILVSTEFDEKVYAEIDGDSKAAIWEMREEATADLRSHEKAYLETDSLMKQAEKEQAEKVARQNELAILEAQLSGIVSDKQGPGAQQYFELAGAKALFEKMGADINKSQKEHKVSENRARDAFDRFVSKVGKEPFREANPELMGLAQMERDSLAANGEQLCDDLSARIELIQHKIESANEHIDRAVASLQGKTQVALRRLKDACAIKMPAEVAELSGLNILKISQNGRRVLSMESDDMAKNLNLFVRKCIKENYYPKKLITESVMALAKNYHRDGLLDIRILQVREGSHDYYLVHDIKSSGGERLTTALLLYITVSALSGKYGHTGGFLVTDNIFGKCSKSEFVRVQLQLAKSLGFQLISTTGLKDKEFMSQYSKILNVKPYQRKSGKGRVANERSVFKGMYHESLAAV